MRRFLFSPSLFPGEALVKWNYCCPACGAEYEIEPTRYLCDVCSKANAPGKPLYGVLECEWKSAGNGKTASVKIEHLGDFHNIPLPVEAGFFPAIPVGKTPLWEPERVRAETGFPRLFLKDDTCNPSGSFKDRASFLVAAFARKWKIKEIALASTGNAASSMAAIGAAADLGITVFLPAAAPVAKRIQVLQYGAELREVAGTYDQAFDESLAYSEATGVLSRNTAYNPLTIEGKKTVSFEIAADLAALATGGVGKQDSVPDHVFVPTGDGVIIAGVIRGFEDLMKLGATTRMPTVWAAQAEGSSAIARALDEDARGMKPFEKVIPSDTLADSISVDVPRNGAYTLAKMKKYGGKAVVVNDSEILEAQRYLSSRSGLFAEPSSACAFAGFMKVRSQLDKDSTVVVMLTGSGLKDIRNAARAVGTTV
jgi:threonine synthase